MKKLNLLVSALVLLSAIGPVSALAEEVKAPVPQAEAPKAENLPIVAVVKADWCPACKKISPTVQGVMKDYMKKAQFVMFDVTSKESSQSALKTAKEAGLEKFFEEYGSRTSTVAIIHPKTKKIIKVFMAEDKKEKYTQALDEAIKAL